MSYLGHFQRTTTDGSLDVATIFEKLRRAFSRFQPETASKVTDEAILLGIAHLNDQQLDDIGIRRKLRKSTWQSSGRGMPPTPVFHFDYFWINI